MEQQEAAEGQIDLFGEDQVLSGLGQCDDLGVGGGTMGDLVAREGVAVHGVDTPVAPDHFGQGHRDIAATGTDVETAPAWSEAEAVQGGDQRSAVDVVTQTRELTHGRGPSGSWVHGPALYGRRATGGSEVWHRMTLYDR